MKSKRKDWYCQLCLSIYGTIEDIPKKNTEATIYEVEGNDTYSYLCFECVLFNIRHFIEYFKGMEIEMIDLEWKSFSGVKKK